MEKITKTDITEKLVFNFGKDTLKFQEILPNGFYWYKRYNSKGVQSGNEIVLPVKYKQPDGKIIYTYPSTNMFGKNGWFYPPRMTREDLISKGNEIIALKSLKNRYR